MYNLLSFIVLLICFNQSLSQSQSQSSDVFVKFMTPQKELVTNELTLPATIKPNEKVNITSTVSEKIEKIFFKEGVSVKKNEILVVLNHFAETAILKQFEAKLKEAETNLERALSLSKNGNISQSIVDNRITERDSLLGKVEEIKAQINDLILRAPFDGIIGLRNFSEGAFIKPGDIISTIYDFSVLKVEASAPEIYSDKIKKGNNVKVKVNTYEESISGKVSVVDPFVDETTRTFKVISNIKKKKN